MIRFLNFKKFEPQFLNCKVLKPYAVEQQSVVPRLRPLLLLFVLACTKNKSGLHLAPQLFRTYPERIQPGRTEIRGHITQRT